MYYNKNNDVLDLSAKTLMIKLQENKQKFLKDLINVKMREGRDRYGLQDVISFALQLPSGGKHTTDRVWCGRDESVSGGDECAERGGFTGRTRT